MKTVLSGENARHLQAEVQFAPLRVQERVDLRRVTPSLEPAVSRRTGRPSTPTLEAIPQTEHELMLARLDVEEGERCVRNHSAEVVGGQVVAFE